MCVYWTKCVRACTSFACVRGCALWRTYWQWQLAKSVSDNRKVSLSVSAWPFEGAVKVIKEASLWFRHCLNYKSQCCRVCRAKGREMFSESVKGLLKSLKNTLVFITVVTSTILSLLLSSSFSQLVSCAVTYEGCISLIGKIIMIHHAELRQ